MKNWVIGVDEVGRGPLAGPVGVGAACIAKDFNWDLLPKVNDSKKLSEKNREAIFLQAQKLKKLGVIDFSVALISSKIIDTKGIMYAINQAMKTSLQKVHTDFLYDEVTVLLDGGLKAPSKYPHQKTIIKGDGKEKIIGLASIVAKVTRDRYMKRIGKKDAYAMYLFGLHKGYGTELHRECILKHGLSDVHRKSFCTKLMGG